MNRLPRREPRSGRLRNGGRLFHAEAVSESAHAPDEGRSVFRLDFLAQAQNVDVDGAIRDGAIVSPYGVEQLFTAEYDARAAHQEFQEAKLRGRERNFLARETDVAAGAVQFQVPGAQDFRGRRGAAKMDLDAGDQLADKERLHDVVVRAQLQTDNAIGFGGAGGQKDHGDVGQFRTAANRLAEFQPIAIRQHHVEDDQVRPFATA